MSPLLPGKLCILTKNLPSPHIADFLVRVLRKHIITGGKWGTRFVGIGDLA
jgi:hypothetical protein